MLTMAVVIPAIIQKRQGQLTIYHATQVLNFATISCLANLAVAPMCRIWWNDSNTPAGITERHLRDEDSDSDADDEKEETGTFEYLGDDEDLRSQKEIQHRLKHLRRASVHRSRAIISFALMAQVAFQWTWAIYMFTSPSYFQTPCSPTTNVVLFAHLFTVEYINENFYIFALWLLFHMGVTVFWGAILVESSAQSLHPLFSRQVTASSVAAGETIIVRWIVNPVMTRIKGFPYDDHKRLAVLLAQLLAAIIGLGLMISTEYQATHNCILLGENMSWGFGQVCYPFH